MTPDEALRALELGCSHRRKVEAVEVLAAVIEQARRQVRHDVVVVAPTDELTLELALAWLRSNADESTETTAVRLVVDEVDRRGTELEQLQVELDELREAVQLDEARFHHPDRLAAIARLLSWGDAVGGEIGGRREVCDCRRAIGADLRLLGITDEEMSTAVRTSIRVELARRAAVAERRALLDGPSS